MNRQPLQYASLKSVILFLEPNLRFNLTRQLPSIRTAEKGTPLKIDNLRFEDNTIMVNDIKYQLSVYRKYQVERPPIEVSGTVMHDLDEYGFKQPASNDLLPGDVSIGTLSYFPVIESDSQEEGKMLKSRLRYCQRRLKNLRDTQSDLGDYEERVNDCRQRLLPFKYRWNQQKSPCDLYLQLTIRTKSTIQSTYRIRYNDKLHNGMKQLMEMLFGKRQDVWKVDYMYLDVSILRWLVSGTLPIVRTLRIRNHESTNFEALKSIVHTESFPLKNLVISFTNFGEEEFNNKIITEAKYLILDCFLPLMRQLVKIQNSNVFITTRMSPSEFCDLVRHWLQHGRPLGTRFLFNFQTQYEANNCFEEISNFSEVLERSERFVKLSMKNSLVLVVSKNERTVVVNGVNMLYWNVEMKVVHGD